MRLFPFGTTAVANGPALINELRNAPDDAFSFAEFADKARTRVILVMWFSLTAHSMSGEDG